MNNKINNVDFYKKNEIDYLNLFIHKLNKTYGYKLPLKQIFYASQPVQLINSLIEFPVQPIVEEKEKQKTVKKEKEIKKDTNVNDYVEELESNLLKDYPFYHKNTLDVDLKEFYLTNQYGFYDSLKKILEPIRKIRDEQEDSCSSTKNEFIMLQHQKIVQSYLNSYTPYRGLLLFHGLGSGKTCSSISILEGMKEDKKIYVFTPASLQDNYKTQMKFCGDKLFRYNNNWEFLNVETKEDYKEVYSLFKEYLFLNHSEKTNLYKFIQKNKGVWLIKEGIENYNDKTEKEKLQIQEQIDILIKLKYTFINYNGITKTTWNRMKQDKNPFDDSVIVIDEAHNFIGSISNKLRENTNSVSTDIYDYILEAENCKVVLLSGTPYINNPCELGVMINLVSGLTKRYEFTLDKPIKQSLFDESLKDINDFNQVTISKNNVFIIKNTHGFVYKENKLTYQPKEQMNPKEGFENYIKKRFIENGYDIKNVNQKSFKKIPDNELEFNNLFIKVETEGKYKDLKVINNKPFFQTRIAGLVSYLGDKTNLMPNFILNEKNEHTHIEYIPMSSHQYSEYSRYYQKEMKMKGPKGDSSYKVFTRQGCNFVFNDDIPRPFPDLTKKIEQEDVDPIPLEEKQLISFEDKKDNKEYQGKILSFLKNIEKNKEEFFYNTLPVFHKNKSDYVPEEEEAGLMKYSPKFFKIIENIISNIGCHLLYSDFRTVEGIEMLRLILKYQGFKELVIEKKNKSYEPRLVGYSDYIYEETPKVFALYTGTETPEVKEIIRNIYNSNLDKLTPSFYQKLNILYNGKLQDLNMNNLHGEIINLMMITSSGAEGIDLQNTRYVHITEPYWHNVRIEQVIGRARRICSHMRLDVKDQNVKVFMYLSVIKHDDKDKNKMISTDEYLHNVMVRKKILSESFLTTLKETAIDCVNTKENKCFRYPIVNELEKSNKVYNEDIEKEPKEKRTKNKNFVTMKLKSKQGIMTNYLVDITNEPNTVYSKVSNKLKQIGRLIDGVIIFD